jgi:DNA polymerase-3 subunit beta
MKVTCIRENLREALGVVGRAAATKSALPALSNVLLSAERGRLKLAATNLEMMVVAWIGCQVEDQGAITVPSRLFIDLISNLPEEEVQLEADARTTSLHVRCGAVDAQIRGIDAQEFPPMPRTEEEPPQAILQASELGAAIKQVLPAVAPDDTRPALAGILWRLRGNKLTLAGADGYRLALKNLTPVGGTGGDVDAIVPRKSAEELARITDLTQDTVQATVMPNQAQILFQTDLFELLSRLIDARYPEFERIIPEGYRVKVITEVEALTRAVKIASFFLEDRNAVRLQIRPGGIVVGSSTTERGATSIPVDAVVEGGELEVSFNYRYLLDALSSMSSRQVSLQLEDAARPVVLSPVGADDYLHLIMPIYTS